MALPRTTSGKVRRSACRDQFLAGTLDLIARSVLDHAVITPVLPVSGSGPDSTAIRGWLATRLAALAGSDLSAIDPRREFASFGLGSLQAARLAGELEEWLGRSISPTLVYDYPTIDALARHLAGEASVLPDPVVTPAHKPEPSPNEPIAIIGIGCRFPGADGPEAYWRLLADGVEGVGPWPEGRRGGRVEGRTGGFLPEVDEFDAEFFEINDREAARVDPQHRLLLEVAWEAIEDAGLVPERLAGSTVGVFVGISTNDYGLLQVGREGSGDAHALTGNASSLAPHRISYHFDFRGRAWPSIRRAPPR